MSDLSRHSRVSLHQTAQVTLLRYVLKKHENLLKSISENILTNKGYLFAANEDDRCDHIVYIHHSLHNGLILENGFEWVAFGICFMKKQHTEKKIFIL
jgi:hypothetical protein